MLELPYIIKGKGSMENKRRLYLFLALLMMVSLLLSGCDKSLEALSNKVEKNMSKREVVDILGRDYEKYEHDDDEFSLVWISEDKSEVVEVYFDDDKEVDDVDWMDEDDWEEWLEEIETKGRVSYDEFIKRFDDTLELMVEKDKHKILFEYEFAEDEDGFKSYIPQYEDSGIGGVRLIFDEDGYIKQGIFAFNSYHEEFIEYNLIINLCFEVGMLGDVLQDIEYGEYYVVNNYCVKQEIDGSIFCNSIYYLED